MAQPSKLQPMIFGLNDNPSFGVSLFAGLQHLLAVFGGIVTAPLIIASGMGLSVTDTSYLITSALLISGLATILQITRVGAFGSGLLSIQGTSFTFIGPILFSFSTLPSTMDDHQKLAIIFGTSALCAILMMPICYYVNKLKRIFTPNVTGTTIILIGVTLVWATLNNLVKQYQTASTTGEEWQILLLTLPVILITLAMGFSKNCWLRLSSITAGLGAGFLMAWLLGRLNTEVMEALNLTFIPEPFKYSMGFDWGVLFVMLPVFFVTATESIGDLTATCSLSKQPTSGNDYWKRIRGGLLGDALNSLIAVCFATFPNTTFSQNNGVIRLTGIASRKVGYFVAGMLIILGFFPIVGGIFQIIPGAVVYSVTLIMFAMVAVAGVNIVKRGGADTRSVSIVAVSVFTGIALNQMPQLLSVFPDEIKMLLSFPVSTGAIAAIALELIIPVRRRSDDASLTSE